MRVGHLEGSPSVTVAYGTSQRTRDLRAGEFAITEADGEAYRLSGLSYATKFDLRRMVDLPYNDDWFGVPPSPRYGQTPMLGVLHPTLMRRVAAAYRAVT